MESLLVSTGITALAEVGDKSQLLALAFATRFKRPIPIILGILMATLINHGLAVSVGFWISSAPLLSIPHWALDALFACITIGILLMPDNMAANKLLLTHRAGIFGGTCLTFFLAEIGDKSQLATIALTAHYSAPLMVMIGTTLGILLVNVPSVLLGSNIANKFPNRIIFLLTVLLFVIMEFAL